MDITFDDYEQLHPEQISEEEFESLLPSASAFIDAVTARRAAAATGYKAERVKHAMIAVIHEMAAQKAARGANGARINSVSNDGYSESYGNSNSVANEEKDLRSIAFRYLSGTGLMGAL